jgi:hypothetical protein
MLKEHAQVGLRRKGSESKSGIIRTIVHQTVIPANDLVGIIFARNSDSNSNKKKWGDSTFTKSKKHCLIAA